MTKNTKPNNVPNFSCPVCRQNVPVGEFTCPNPACQADLKTPEYAEKIAESLFLLAQELSHKKRYKAAIQLLEASLQYNPTYLDSWKALATNYTITRNPLEALRCWQQVASIRPEEPNVKSETEKIKTNINKNLKPKNGCFIFSIVAIVVLLLAALAVDIFIYPMRIPIPQVENIISTYRPTSLRRPEQTGRSQFMTPTPTPDLVRLANKNLQSDPDLKSLPVQIKQDGAALVLSGQLPNQVLKDNYESFLKKIPGLSLLDSSLLKVVPPDLAGEIQKKLDEMPEFKEQKITVKQNGLDVQLSGTVNSPEMKKKAENTAASVADVSHVDSRNIIIVPPAFAEKVKANLKNDPRTSCFDITVDQIDWNIYLKGLVYSQQAKDVVENLARDVTGVKAVDLNHLLIKPPVWNYTVKDNDFLEWIALNLYGDASKTKLIIDSNPGKFPIQPGDVLQIPAEDSVFGGKPAVDCTSGK